MWQKTLSKLFNDFEASFVRFIKHLILIRLKVKVLEVGRCLKLFLSVFVFTADTRP